ncbi:MAG: aryl-sulfate sulfotransferase [Candidatus Kapabacteria bacterium]|nr:aryl-sulfate sulfotransferase [Candidatus Kapabacteria bacterium]
MKINTILKTILVFLFTFCLIQANDKIEPKINVKILNNPEPGYIFVGTTQSDMGIMDNYGNSIDTAAFRILGDGFDLKLQKNGMLTYFNPEFNTFYGVNSKYQIVDSFAAPTSLLTDFHELVLNADGSYFIMSQDNRKMDMSKIIPNGKENATIAGFMIYEYNSNKQEVWKWSTWENFAVTDATSDIDLTQDFIKYCHINSIEKDIFDGNIIISSRHLDEVTKINHTTGKIIWRMGGTYCKNNQFKFPKDTIGDFFGFTHQHDVRRLTNGNLLMLDNGNLRTNKFTRAVEYKLDENNKTATKVWEFIPSDNYYAEAMGSVQRLPNGGTLIGMADRIYEVDKNQNITYYGVLENLNYSYRSYKYVYNMGGVNKSLTKSGTYDFSATNNQTDVILALTTISKSGRLTVEKHNYKPRAIPFESYTPTKILNYRWVVSGEVGSITGKIRINTQNLIGFNLNDTFSIYYRPIEASGNFSKLTTTYIASSKSLEASILNGGEFILCNSKALPSIAPYLKSPLKETLYKNDSPLKWNFAIGADSYIVQVSNISDFSTILVEKLTNELSYSFTNYDFGSKYFWRVKARNTEFNYYSPWSETWNFRTFIETPKLFEPSNNTIRQSIESVKVKWNFVKNALNYSLEISEDSLFVSKNKFARSDIYDTNYLYQALKPYTTYFWRVAAINGDGFTDWSNVFQFKTALTIPKLVSPLNKSLGVEVSSLLVYEKSLESDYFQFQISKYFDFNQIEQEGFTSKTQNTNFTKLASFTKHFWRVRAIHNSDTSDWSEIYQFTTQIVVPKLQYPTNYAINELQDIGLRWELINGANNYEISLSDDISFNSSKTFSNSTNILAISSLKPLQDYYWKVKAIYSGGNSSWSEIWKFKTGPSPTLDKPILLLPNNSTIDLATNVVLSWLKVFNAENYRVQVSKNIDFDEFEQDSLTNFFESLLLNLENERTYYWRVQAQSNNAISLWSEIRNFTIGGKSIPSFPLSISPKNKAIIADSLVNFVWHSVENVSDYGLIIAEDIGLTKSRQEYPKIADTTKSIMLMTNKTYFWKLYSKTLKVQSLDSPIYSFSLISDINSVSDFKNSKFTIYPNPVCDYINIVSSEFIENTIVLLKDITGKQIKVVDCKDNISGNYKINCSDLPQGLYTIQIIAPNFSDMLYFIKE